MVAALVNVIAVDGELILVSVSMGNLLLVLQLLLLQLLFLDMLSLFIYS